MAHSQSGTQADKKRPRGPKTPRLAGTRCVWPSGVQARYGISLQTRWRWEREGKLPPRDVFVDGEPVGWQPETLEAADRGAAHV
jgi:hypothetical protein